MGYLSYVLIQATIVFTLADIYLSIVLMSVGICLYSADFVSDIEEDIRQLNYGLQLMEKGKNKKFDVKRNMIEIIQFHFRIIQLSQSTSYLHVSQYDRNSPCLSCRFTKNFSNTNSKIVFVYLAYSLMSICSLLLQMNVVRWNLDYFHW